MLFKNMMKLLRLQETVFALPLAYSGMLLISEKLPPFSVWFWVTLSVISARNFGMALNRVIDAKIDAQNERTQHRLIPSGELSVRFVLLASLFFAFVFVCSAWNLNALCLKLAPGILFLIASYSYFKRFSASSHMVLGLTESFAPIGGALAVHPHFSYALLPLPFFVLFWISGLDIIYSCQDHSFDKKTGLHSIPVKYGIPQALKISQACYVIALLILIGLGYGLGFSLLYWLGCVALGVLFFRQHQLIHFPINDKMIMRAFSLNKAISILLFLCFLGCGQNQ